jgi:hypothetical protein
MEDIMAKALNVQKPIENNINTKNARYNPLKRRYRLTAYDIERSNSIRKEICESPLEANMNQVWWQYLRDNRNQYGRLLRR